MGYNSVLLVLNDALHEIREDPEFGESVYQSLNNFHDDYRVASAKSKSGIFCNAATVISSDHADVSQVVVVKHNTGWTYRYGHALPQHVLEDLAFVLEEHGYKISKRSKKKDLDPSL